MASPSPPDVFAENPYSNHRLSVIEKEVLWEYAKLAENLKLLKQKVRDLTGKPDAVLAARLRAVEAKMGLILTLFKASVWGVINDHNVGAPFSDSSEFTDETFTR
ncbi:hypothetical protein MVEN_02017100 [Mycena venus]|uniref:DASH complex subunit DAD3 n=1 Tax=Mycena venus TaxID=2733690 RepID=A0A8H6XB05_9AGAR|nr:hypothetical protein MVEN_02017100 [Mycena venus]